MRWLRFMIVGTGLIGAVMLFHSRFGLVLSVGESMRPTLISGELLLVDRAAYRHAEPRRGDIVVARYHGGWITKRVVGLPGETVAVSAGHLLVNEQPCQESYRLLPGLLRIGPGKLQPDRYALLGDNRDMSAEETIHAVVARDQILGRVAGSLRLGRRESMTAADGEDVVQSTEGVGGPEPATHLPGT